MATTSSLGTSDSRKQTQQIFLDATAGLLRLGRLRREMRLFLDWLRRSYGQHCWLQTIIHRIQIHFTGRSRRITMRGLFMRAILIRKDTLSHTTTFSLMVVRISPGRSMMELLLFSQLLLVVSDRMIPKTIERYGNSIPPLRPSRLKTHDHLNAAPVIINSIFIFHAYHNDWVYRRSTN